MTGSLAVFLEGRHIGLLERNRSGTLALTYRDEYSRGEGSTPLSLSMPPQMARHSGAVVHNWLSNLLPDNGQVLDRWAAQFRVSANSPFALLHHVGRDVAGAVQFIPESLVAEYEQGGNAGGEIEWLTNDGLRERLDRLRVDPAAWTPAHAAGQFSLAGAQPKIALRREGHRWGLPSGREPTTHILKPYAGGLPQQALNEHLSLALAREVGLAAARSEILRVGDHAVVAVERYDRTGATPIRRVHQEDMCQALGLPPGKKYQSEGGPGIVRIVNLIGRTQGPYVSRDDIDRFLQAQAFAWAIAATDAHAKNYGILMSGNRMTLAPLYDLHSAAPYLTGERRSLNPGELSVHTAGLAMSVGGERVFSRVTGKEWRQLASWLTLDAAYVSELVFDLVQQIPGAVAVVAARETGARERSGAESAFVELYAKTVTRQARLSLASLAGRGGSRRR